MMLVLIGSMVALESEPSEVVGYVKYNVVNGDYNMIALPLTSDLTLASQLATVVDPDISSVIKWNAGGWQQYITSSPASDYAITGNQSFLVYMEVSADVEFYSAGAVGVCPTYDIAANDFTQIMLPLERSDLTLASELAADIGTDVTSVITWTGGGWQQYITSSPASDYAINIGDGFLIYSDAEILGWGPAATDPITSKNKYNPKKTNQK